MTTASRAVRARVPSGADDACEHLEHLEHGVVEPVVEHLVEHLERTPRPCMLMHRSPRQNGRNGARSNITSLISALPGLFPQVTAPCMVMRSPAGRYQPPCHGPWWMSMHPQGVPARA